MSCQLFPTNAVIGEHLSNLSLRLQDIIRLEAEDTRLASPPELGVRFCELLRCNLTDAYNLRLNPVFGVVKMVNLLEFLPLLLGDPLRRCTAICRLFLVIFSLLLVPSFFGHRR
jgi:hypothetical protein